VNLAWPFRFREPLNSDEKRRLAFTSAQAWGADIIFDELFKERDQGGGDLC
jgi:hypothetical protein